MKFNAEHKNHPGFKAVKWLMEKAEVTKIDDSPYTDESGLSIESNFTCKEFKGAVPHVMETHLYELAKLGYRHPKSIESIINISWVSNNGDYKEHSVVVTFGKRNGKIHFIYKVDTYKQKPCYAA